MTASAIVALITAIMKAIPALESLVAQIIAGVLKSEYKGWISSNKKAVADAIANQDQTPIEVQLGNTNAGGVSGTPGTSIVDSLPGVK